MNLDEVKYFCDMNIRVYSNKDEFITSYMNDKKIKDIKFIENENVGSQCICCVYNNDCIVICFRGSSELLDWFHNFKAFRENITGINNNKILVHDGFYDIYMGIKDEIFSYVNDITQKKQIKRILYTGHSAGGSESQICLVELASLYPNLKHDSVTFGSPRTGNKYFVQEFHKKCNLSYQFVNGHDPVPHLPTRLRFNNTDYWYHIKKNKIVKTKHILWCCCTDLKKQSIEQHFPEEYLLSLNAMNFLQ